MLDQIVVLFVMSAALVSATLCVLSRDITNSLLFFMGCILSVSTVIFEYRLPVIAVFVALGGISLTTVLLVLNSCCSSTAASGQERKHLFSGLWLGVNALAMGFSILKFSNIEITFQHKYYDSTMYSLTVLLALTCFVVIFGCRVFLRNQK